MKRNFFLILMVALAAVVELGQSAMALDPISNVKEDDAEMNAAIAKARGLLPHFWQTFEKPMRGETSFALKVKITDQNGTEHFWVNELERKDGKIFGTIDNDAEIVKSVKLGQRIEVPEADISDWTYLREEKMVGNYTLRVLFKTMKPEQAEQFRKMIVDP